MTTNRTLRTAAAVVAGGLLLVPLAGCSGTEQNSGSSVLTTAEDAAETASSAAESAAGTVEENVDCSGNSCSVTLGTGAEAEILGTTLAFESVEAGEATLRVGEETVTCSEGETVTAGPLELECTMVGEDSVELTAGLG